MELIRMKTSIIVGGLLLGCLSLETAAFADKVCIRAKINKGAVSFTKKIVQTKCPKKFTELVDTSTLKGPAGTDGSLRVYGDGSKGDFVASGSVSLDEANLQFTNFTVNAGATLTVASGSVIRCTGTFSNLGTITVQPFAEGQFVGESASASITISPLIAAHPGVVANVPYNGTYGTNAATQSGGGGGNGLSSQEAKNLLLPGLSGGSGGGAGANGGGSGGGTMAVICSSGIVNGGTINAKGVDPAAVGGGGGGGGGIVILASKSSITNSGLIDVSGGNGAPAASFGGSGGGGGGGIVHLLAPSIAQSGTVTVGGGLKGTSTTVSSTPRSAGGGGGSCGGDGGRGGNVATNGAVSLHVDGSPGYVFQTATDPTALIR
jgi:hypothetical protein